MPLVCKGGLMYLELQGIPTDKDLQTYPSVLTEFQSIRTLSNPNPNG